MELGIQPTKAKLLTRAIRWTPIAILTGIIRNG